MRLRRQASRVSLSAGGVVSIHRCPRHQQVPARWEVDRAVQGLGQGHSMAHRYPTLAQKTPPPPLPPMQTQTQSPPLSQMAAAELPSPPPPPSSSSASSVVASAVLDTSLSKPVKSGLRPQDSAAVAAQPAVSPTAVEKPVAVVVATPATAESTAAVAAESPPPLVHTIVHPSSGAKHHGHIIFFGSVVLAVMAAVVARQKYRRWKTFNTLANNKFVNFEAIRYR